MFEVEYGIKGAYRINRKVFDSLEEAEKFANRWRRSNSTNNYWAKIKEA